MSMADKQPGGPAQELASAAEEGIVPPVSSLPAPVVASAEDPIYVSKREVRKNAGKGTSKKSTYFLEFYLVDNHGYETLAATGEDQGDAHYTYRNVPSFTKYGEKSLHNRKELLSWLDKIIDDTQRAHNFHLVSDDEDVLSASVAPGSPVNLPTFITFRQQKVQDESGCRHQKWWLVDDNGHEHLAVVGDEREPRDGHYNYVAEKPFSLIRPLACQNQAKVTSYLEDWITHPQQNSQDAGPVASPSRSQQRTYITTAAPSVSAAAAGAAGEGDATSEPPPVAATPASSQPSSALEAGTTAPAKKTGWGSQSKAMRSSLRGKASKGGKGSKSGKGGIKRNTSFGFQPGDGIADGISGRRRSMNEEEAIEAAAQDAVTTELHRRAAARAAWQLAARRSALEWLRHPVPASTADYVTDWLAVLRDALAALYPASAPAPGHEACNGALAETDTAPRMADVSEHQRASEASGAPLSSTEAPSSALASIADGYPSEDDGAGAAGCANEAGPTGVDGADLAPANGNLGRPGGPAGAALGEDGGTSAVQPRVRADPVALTEALDAIRELASLHVTLPLLASTEILPTLQKLTSHPESAIRDMAKAALQNWVRACGHQLRVLLDPHFVSDPRRDAAAVLKAAAERIAATRRGREKPSSSASASLPSQAQQPSAALGQVLASTEHGAAAAGSTAAGPATEGTSGKGLPAAIALPSALALPALGLPEGLPVGSTPQNILALLQEHAERLAGGSQPLQPITPGALLANALANNPAFTPALSGDGSGNLERRRLEFGTPASLSLGALQALSQNLLSPAASSGGIPGSGPAIVPDSAANAIAAEIAQASSMDLDGPAGQGGGAERAAMPEKAVGPRSSRGGSRLRMASGGDPPAPDGGASVKVSGTARQRVAGHKDGAGAAERPARKKRKRSSGAGLKELGLTSDDEEDSDDEWGSSEGDDDDDDPDDGGEVDAGPIGRAVSFLARQKGRLAACKQRRVAHVCAQAVDGTIARLAAAGLDAAAMPDLAQACDAIKAAAGKLSQDAQPQANQRAKRDAEQALQRLADSVEALQ